MWQNIAIVLIGIAVAVYAGWKIYRALFRKKTGTKDFCCGCNGCSLRQPDAKDCGTSAANPNKKKKNTGKRLR